MTPAVKPRHESEPRSIPPADRELLAELYSHATMFVLPSDLEGMSIALLEAMSMALPVLVSDIPENSTVVGDAGFTFLAGNVPNLRQKLDQLLSDPAALAAAGNRAAAAAEPFQWSRVVDELEQLYYECAGQTVEAVAG